MYGSSGRKPAPPKGYVPGLGRGASGFSTRSDLGNMASGPGGVDAGSEAPGASSSGVIGSGSRSAEQRAAKMQMMRASQQQRSVGPSPWGQAPAGYVAGAGRGASKMGEQATGVVGARTATDDDDNDDGPGNDIRNSSSSGPLPGQFDDAAGGTNTSNHRPTDEDDEADLIWAAIDERMSHRRKKKSAANAKKRKAVNGDDDNADDHDDDPQVQTRKQIARDFRDCKQQLATVSEEAWMNIPDATGDQSLKWKRQQEKRNRGPNGSDVYTPLTDSLIEQRAAITGGANMNLNAAADDGSMTALTNMSNIGQARGTVLGMSLDKMSDSVSGQTVVDPQGYLTSMTQSTIGGADLIGNNNLGDIQKARLLLKSVRDTNPHHGPGWIASARVEEAAGKTLKARKLIQEGCSMCPTSQDVWLEAARLHPPDVSKSILAAAVRKLPHSTALFLKAADLEHNVDAKKIVLRKALEANPTSLTLWKTAIELEDSSENAKILLSVAVEKVPTAVELWLALARLETYKNAQKVLNQARRALPAERSIWIAASKLEEAYLTSSNDKDSNENDGDSDSRMVVDEDAKSDEQKKQSKQSSQKQAHDIVNKIMNRAFSSLAKNDAVVTRSQWLEEAESAEKSGAPLTCAAIVQNAIGLGVEDEDRQRTWADDAKNALKRQSVETSRAILALALKTFPSKRALWMQAVDLEKNHGTPQSLDEVLMAASERLPQIEVFWLLRAKEQWTTLNNVDKARDILTQAFSINTDSENVWLAAAKLEWETGEMERARVLLERARDRAPSARVYMKSALLERELQNYKAALSLLEEGISKYPTFAKLYMMAGQIYSEDMKMKKKSHLDKARKVYQEGLEKCPNNIVLWILASRLEETAHTFGDQSVNGSAADQKLTAGAPSTVGAGFTKARSLLELGRLKNPKNDELWLEAVRLERRSGNTKLAESLMARALQECPKSGRLLAENVLTAPRVEQKARSRDAVGANAESPLVIAAVAALFSSDRKTEKARKWYERAVLLDQDNGDLWARYYKFEQQHGNVDKINAVRERCIKAEPKHGEVWQSVAKSMENRHKRIVECLELVAAKL